MATFKVGMRVRIRMDAIPNSECGDASQQAIGREGVLVSRETHWHWQWRVQVVGIEPLLYAREDALEPLTDPLADAFIERIKRLEREPAPMVKETA
jgi:hypothetical protein